MKKYTVIWNNVFVRGSHRFSTVEVSRFEVNDVKEIMQTNLADDISYIFEGWPLMEGQKESDIKEDLSKYAI